MRNEASLRLELFVRDLPASIAFYRDVLGFTVGRDDPGYTDVHLGRVAFGLGPQDGLPESHHFGRSALQQQKGTGVEIVIEVDDIDSLYERVLASGWPITSGLTKRPWGLTDFRIIDPDGYYIRPTSRG